MPRALAIVNERGAGLGALEPLLRHHGYEVTTVMGQDIETVADITAPDLVITLGSSAAVYTTARHPVVATQIDLLQERLHHRLPTLGVCFGAQLIATALGETVRPGPTREVGFRTVTATEAGRSSPLRHADGVPLMQWHGDTFDLPAGAVLLASSEAYRVEAFAVGTAVLGLQFHPELTPGMAAAWLDGDGEYAAEAGYTAEVLAADIAAGRFAAMERVTGLILAEWLEAVRDPAEQPRRPGG